MPVRKLKNEGQKKRSIDESVLKSVDYMHTQLRTLVSNVVEDEIIEIDENMDMKNRMLGVTEKIATLDHYNRLMKTHIDQELLNVRQERNEIVTNNAAIDEEIRRLREQAEQDDEAVRLVEEAEGKRRRGFNPEMTKEAVKKIKTATTQGEKMFDPQQSEMAKEIRSILKVNDDDDVVIQDRGLNESDIKCPYAHIVFTDAYCNKGNKGCGHHLEKQSLDLLQSKNPNKPFPCPMMGCNGMWQDKTSEPDKKFMRKVEKFIAQRDSGGASGRGKKNKTVAIEEEEEDYTEI